MDVYRKIALNTKDNCALETYILPFNYDDSQICSYAKMRNFTKNNQIVKRDDRQAELEYDWVEALPTKDNLKPSSLNPLFSLKKPDSHRPFVSFLVEGELARIIQNDADLWDTQQSEEIYKRIAELMDDTLYFNNDGIRPDGIFSDTSIFKNLETRGTDALSETSIDANNTAMLDGGADLLKLINSVPKQASNNKFFVSETAYNFLSKITYNGIKIFTIDGRGERIFGKPVVFVEQMPPITDPNFFIAYGNFYDTFSIFTDKNIKVEKKYGEYGEDALFYASIGLATQITNIDLMGILRVKK